MELHALPHLQREVKSKELWEGERRFIDFCLFKKWGRWIYRMEKIWWVVSLSIYSAECDNADTLLKDSICKVNQAFAYYKCHSQPVKNKSMKLPYLFLYSTAFQSSIGGCLRVIWTENRLYVNKNTIMLPSIFSFYKSGYECIETRPQQKKSK